MSIDNISLISCTNTISNHRDYQRDIQKENLKDSNNQDEDNCITEPSKTVSKPDSDDESENIIPWRAQLRKTNSKLSLIG